MSLFKSSRRRLKLQESSKFTPINKRLDFNIIGLSPPPTNLMSTQFDLEMDSIVVDSTSSPTTGGGSSETFSPCRTRSGLVYESGLKKRKFRNCGSKKKLKKNGGTRSRMASGQSGTGSVADCEENGSENSDDNLVGESICDRLGFQTDSAVLARPQSPGVAAFTDRIPSSPPHRISRYSQPTELCSPPPRLPMSRFSVPRERKYKHDIPSSPIHNQVIEAELSSPLVKQWNPSSGQHYLDEPQSPLLSCSPPTNNMRAMRIFDGLTSPNTACCALTSPRGCVVTSPRSTPRLHTLKSRLVFGDDGEPRRASLPNPQIFECDTTTAPGSLRKSANINPFTPAAMLLASKKRSRTNRSMDSSVGSSREELQASLDSLEDVEDPEEVEDSDMDVDTSQAKRIRVSDINITRYELEFLELEEIASGQFGEVKKSRHRLDGIVYAIKISKKPIRMNSHDEKMAMNEVFAHAAMMKHKHVVRYYNSWVEKGQVYIQNEYCEGGSLHNKIDEFRRSGGRFSEQELKKIIIHISKGLQYIHSKQLVHLDIKPANVFISFEYSAPSPNAKADSNSTDSGAASGDFSPPHQRIVGGMDEEEAAAGSSPLGGEGEKVYYKIGDLGHVASVWGGYMAPEEGDCRYMAPELLQMEPERTLLPKADIFSLGLTMYEAASLTILPRNSSDDVLYERLKCGDLPYLDNYSREFNNLLKMMVSPDPLARPSAAKILSNSSLNPSMNKSRSQLYKELKEAREKVASLELQLAANSVGGMTATIGVGRTTTRFSRMVALGSAAHHQDKENSEPGTGKIKRLVGRGATRSTSLIM